MKRLSTTYLNLALSLALASLFSPMLQTESHAAPSATTSQETTVKVDELMRQSGYKYRKASDTVWTISRQGKNMANFEVIVASGSGYFIAGVIVARKKELRVTNDLTVKLLHLAHETDYVKIGFDSAEDLFARAELRPRLLDRQSFKEVIEDASAAADKVYGEIKPFLNTP